MNKLKIHLAILDGVQTNWTQFPTGTTQWRLLPNLVHMVQWFQDEIKMWKVHRRKTPPDSKSSTLTLVKWATSMNQWLTRDCIGHMIIHPLFGFEQIFKSPFILSILGTTGLDTGGCLIARDKKIFGYKSPNFWQVWWALGQIFPAFRQLKLWVTSFNGQAGKKVTPCTLFLA